MRLNSGLVHLKESNLLHKTLLSLLLRTDFTYMNKILVIKLYFTLEKMYLQD